jgi:hypothetical protein
MRVGTSGTIDLGSNYSNTRIVANNGSSSASDRYANKTEMFAYGGLTGTTSTAYTFCNMEIFIPNYTSTTPKPCIFDNASENFTQTSAYENESFSGLYRGSGAITNLLFSTYNGGNFDRYSTFTLYGTIHY